MDAEPMLIAKGTSEIHILPRMANRHGLITGATGTGKTVSLQVLAENFSRIGVPVFMADVKGDLSGISKPGIETPKIGERLDKLKLRPFEFSGKPVVCWDIFGEQGHPVRTTISDMGPLLLSRLFNLSEIQSGVLSLVFKVADDNGLLLLDSKDLRAILQYCGEHADEFEPNTAAFPRLRSGPSSGLSSTSKLRAATSSSANRPSTLTISSRPTPRAGA